MRPRCKLGFFAALGLAALCLCGSPPASAQLIDFSGGFAGATGLQLNGTAVISGSNLRLTDGGFHEAGSAFTTSAVGIHQFTTQFTFLLQNGTIPSADGITFTVQPVAPTALGLDGGGLAYDTMPSSVAVKFDLFNNSGEGINSTGLYTNGAFPGVPAVNLNGTGIDLHSQHTFRVKLSYDGTTLTETITDTVTSASFTTSYTVNIPAVVGATTAFVGFTGATGDLSAIQSIQTWTFQGCPPPVVKCDTKLASLWPPNHDLVDVGLTFSVSSPCKIVSTGISVTSDEPADAVTGDGTFSPDARFIRNAAGQIVGLRLRSERQGDGDGRVYLIRVTAVDEVGQKGSACCTVVVPHDQSVGSIASVNAQAAAAKAACESSGTVLPNNVLGPPPDGPAPEIGPKQ